jgi:membrane fusion protein (multidrug efflux system)
MADYEKTTTINPAAAEAEARQPVLSSGRAKRLYLILGGAVLALLLIYGIFVLVTHGRESTDDAQVSADIVPVAPRIAGQVIAVHVTENQLVHKGDLIAELDPNDAQVKVAQAQSDLDTALAQAQQADAQTQVTQANASGGLNAARGAVQSMQQSVGTSAAAVNEARAGVSRAEANAAKAAADWKRAEELGGKGDISKAQVDAARAANEAAQADVASARAKLASSQNAQQAAQANVVQAQGKLEQSAPVSAQVAAARATAALAHAKVNAQQAVLQAAQLNLSYTKITAPADGIASRLSVHPGGLVAPGTPIVQLVPLRTYLIANFKETQVKEMRPGQRATIKTDALGGQEFEGKVESISGGTGASFSLLPPDNASGNYVKVVQRVPVRVSWNGPTSDRVAAGASAEVTVYTK